MTNTRSNSFLFVSMLLLLACCAALLINAAQRSAPIIDVDDLLDIPVTDHAKNKALAGEFSVTAILQRIGQRKCQPIYFMACVSTDAVVYVCPVEAGSDLWIGLIVGWNTPQVITAYPATQAWWQALAVRDNCNPPEHKLIMLVP